SRDGPMWRRLRRISRRRRLLTIRFFRTRVPFRGMWIIWDRLSFPKRDGRYSLTALRYRSMHGRLRYTKATDLNNVLTVTILTINRLRAIPSKWITIG